MKPLTYFCVDSPAGYWLGVYQDQDLIFFGSFATGSARLYTELDIFLMKHFKLQLVDLASSKISDSDFWHTPKKIKLLGSPFQLQVWSALRLLPKGSTCTYSELAEMIGKSTAVRAVASAVAKNPIAYWVPCHRVQYKNSNRQAYNWGSHLKTQLLKFERDKKYSAAEL